MLLKSRKEVINLILAALAFCTVSVLAGDKNKIELVFTSERTISDLPPLSSLYHIAFLKSGIAVIDEDKTSLKIIQPEMSPITIRADSGGHFFYISSRLNSNLILTGMVPGDGSNKYKWAGRDIGGRIVMGPLYTEATISISPDGKYFFSHYDVGNDFNQPVLFDSSGGLLIQFESVTNNWDITFIDETKMLYRDGGDVLVYSLPELKVVDKFTAGHIENADLPYTSISPDGAVYAFQSRDKIIVMNLENGNTSNIKKAKPNGIATYPPTLLSDSGQYLIVFKSNSGHSCLDIYRHDNTGYSLVRNEIEIFEGEGYSLFPLRSFISDDFLIANYQRLFDSSFECEARILELNCILDSLNCHKDVHGLLMPVENSFEFNVATFSKSAAMFKTMRIRKTEEL